MPNSLSPARAAEMGRRGQAVRWAKYVRKADRLAQTSRAREAAFAIYLTQADELTAKLGDGPLTEAERIDRAKQLRRARLTELRLRSHKAPK